MKLSNIRTEDFVEAGIEKTRLVCDVENCSFSDSKQLYYIVPREIRDWLSTDVYDSFMVAMYVSIMHYNEALEIDGLISKKLYLNLMYELSASQRDFDNTMSLPNIKVKGYADAQKNNELHTGVGFAAGVDSFATLHDHYWHPIDEERKIDTLFFLRVDNYGDPLDPDNKTKAEDNYNSLTKKYAEKVGLPSIYMDSNIFEFYPKHGTFRILGFLGRVSMILALQRSLKYFYFSADLTYGQMLEVVDMFKNQPYNMRYWYYTAQPYACPMLSPRGLELISDGARYTRGDKIELIIHDPYVKDFLNVCCEGGLDGGAKNCSHCRKCKQTMLTLDILGVLDEFKGVFDMEYFRRHAYGFKCHAVYYNTKEEYSMVNVQLAEKYHYPMPSKFAAWFHLFANKLLGVLGVGKIKRMLKK